MHVSQNDNHLLFTVRSTNTSACCPTCKQVALRPHSRYTRLIQDLPISNESVTILLISKKWFCDNPMCTVKVFTERYEWLAPNSRRTLRVEEVLRKIAFSTSCLAAEKIAHALQLPVSHDVLLTIIHKTDIKPEVSPFCRSR
ncbi:transposase family protein [Bacillus sp. JJ864]|uniref:transposase family protein n=1 Tax=Bacillus sp. JJ864 TaxID=3122975 RepID=UPI002FFDEDC7